jgi:transcriptional antiterminator NusG
MDMQEPEEQRLEDEQIEPAEDIVEGPSDEPVLNDSAASESDEEPASVTQSVDEAEEASVEEGAGEEPAPDVSSEVEVDADLGVKPDSDVSMDDGSEPVLASEETRPGEEPGGDSTAWFVIHCYSGYENKVRHNLEQRIETMGMKDMIFDVVVPTQEEIEVRDGKRRTVERHIFPGYVLVNMILTEESWYVVRNTPGVTGFVGMGNNPTPLRPEEVAQIVKRMEADAPTVKVTFKVGERVRIVDGPFNDFRGVVSEIDMERTKVRVMVSFFGRETPVELDFLQVEKA